ncbi:hypothetical protein C8K18_101630 [Paraburkholderia sp. GV068]|nr:hypothetical protein C8K19_101555 [Paraburkholderia sp. GV072]PUB09113.1 hypothetical protein C8K18_101630 [Paraburkholderia sp. GV068]
MEFPVGGLPRADVTGRVPFVHRVFCTRDVILSQVGYRVPERQNLKCGTHPGNLNDGCLIEQWDIHAFTLARNQQAASFQTPECFPDRNVTGIELICDCVLPNSRSRPKIAPDKSVRPAPPQCVQEVNPSCLHPRLLSLCRRCPDIAAGNRNRFIQRAVLYQAFYRFDIVMHPPIVTHHRRNDRSDFLQRRGCAKAERQV